MEQQTRSLTVNASRGTIYDRNGNIMAISATAQNVVISPRDIADKELDLHLIASGLSEILGVDYDTIIKKAGNTASQYEIIKRQVESDIETRVREFISENKLSAGIYLQPTTKRYYPYSALASHVIGFVGTDNTGLYGTEALYDASLQGTAGRVVTAKTASGTEMLYKFEQYYDAKDGDNLYLSIDTTIQYYCERILEEGIQKFEVQNGGVVIAMNPKTGAILGLANSPNYDLNNYSIVLDEEIRQQLASLQGDAYKELLGKAQLEQWRNRAVSDTYEPGSTFKTLVLAMALEERAVTLNDRFFCSGSVNVAGWNISCHKHAGHGSQNLTEAVCNSCNPAFIAIGQRVGAKKFYEYLENFGFLGTTGVDLQGEASGIIWDRKYFTGPEGVASLAVGSFGQTLKITPLQLITACAAVANGGYLLEPYVVDKIVDAKGNTVKSREVNVIRQVISEETAATVRDILEQNVSGGGTGKNAYAAGYRIAGKTGTSEKRDEDTGNLIVSFMGFAPANDPEVIALVLYDSPLAASPGGNYTRGGYYISGGNMAAPMAGKLLKEISDYLGLDKQYTSEELETADTAVPNLIDLSLEEAKSALAKRDLGSRVVGDGPLVTGQIPAAAPRFERLAGYSLHGRRKTRRYRRRAKRDRAFSRGGQ